jgi:hypothetical protein
MKVKKIIMMIISTSHETTTKYVWKLNKFIDPSNYMQSLLFRVMDLA